MPLKNIRVVIPLADDDAVIEGEPGLPAGRLHGFSAVLCDSPEGTTPVGWAYGLDAPADEVPCLAALELLEGSESRGFLWVSEGGYTTALTALDALKAVAWNKGITGYHPMHGLPINEGSTVRAVHSDTGTFPATTWLILNFWIDIDAEVMLDGAPQL